MAGRKFITWDSVNSLYIYIYELHFGAKDYSEMQIPFLIFNANCKYDILKKNSIHMKFRTSKQIIYFILLKLIGRFSRILLDSFNHNKFITLFLLKTVIMDKNKRMIYKHPTEH